jgi:hypothetical protein
VKLSIFAYNRDCKGKQQELFEEEEEEGNAIKYYENVISS